MDRTGTLRRTEEIVKAIATLKVELVKGQFTPAALYYPTIIECLEELLLRRNIRDDQNN